ncbi:GIN domain-containing protein [Labrys neptuniae]
MPSKLGKLAAFSFVIALVCLFLGTSLAGPNDGSPWRGWRWTTLTGWGACPALPQSGDGKAGSVTLPWDNDGSLTIAVPASVSYAPGPQSSAVISGDPTLIGHVRLSAGRLALDDDCDIPFGAVTVRLTGGPVKDWTVNGSGELHLAAIAQDRLALRLHGSAQATGEGTVEQLNLRISGSGSADLAKLDAKAAEIRISGSGEAGIAASESADVTLSGSGRVTLRGKPRLTTQIHGSGRIEEVP